VLGVALAVELVHVDRRLAELAREVDGLRAGVGLVGASAIGVTSPS
jgi:hypothetical protein